MRKAFLILPLLIIAGLLAGSYGALHNQMSYTVSPDYFHQFKFHQFNLAPSLQDRFGASIVGFTASWWMGIIIGLFIIPIGFYRLSKKQYFISRLKAFAIVTVTSMMTSAIALTFAFIFVTSDNVGEVTRLSQVINNPVEFIRAETMHNFSYLGGILGIFTSRKFLALQCQKN